MTTAAPPALSPHHHPGVYRQLLTYVSDHTMEVLRDDGVYRHLKFCGPTNNIGSFELVTWPGALVIRGDIGQGFIFNATDDMLQFFHRQPGCINPDYWSEKLTRGSRDVRVYREELLLAAALAEMNEWVLTAAARQHARTDFIERWEDITSGDDESQKDLVRSFLYRRPPFRFPAIFSNPFKPLELAQLEAAITESDTLTNNERSAVLADFRHQWTRAELIAESDRNLTENVGRDLVETFTWAGYDQSYLGFGPDTDEWETTGYDHHFLLACHAIAWGVRHYYTTQIPLTEGS